MKNKSPDATIHLSFADSFDFAKRLTLGAVQICLDAAIFWLCLRLTGSLLFPRAYLGQQREIFFCGVFLVCFCFNALYSFRVWMFWDEMREVLKASVTASLLIVLYLFIFKLQLSRGLIVVSAVLFAPTCLLGRYFFRRAAVRTGFLRKYVLVVGAGKTGEIYAQKVAKHPFMGCEVLGFLDDDPNKQGRYIAGSPVLGRIEDFENVTRGQIVDEVVVAISTADRTLLAHILNIVEMRVKRVSYIPDMYMLTTFSATMRDIDGLPLISASQGLLNPMNRALKSVMDYCGALVALVLFSPLFLYAAWQVKRGDGGAVFFKQTRTGKDLTHFTMYKFRTMIPDAEKQLSELLKDEEVKREYEVAFKLKEDPRITKVGRFLRRSSLDELPQLINVLRGEMSLIGPRPFVPQEIEPRYGKMARQIYSVKPGLSGIWQVNGRNDILDYEQSRNLDLYYIHNWSLWLDIVILFRTVQILIKADGAY